MLRKKDGTHLKKAIYGGAEFIHDHYLKNPEQNTLYSMRWNPKTQVSINMLLISIGRRVTQQLWLISIKI